MSCIQFNNYGDESELFRTLLEIYNGEESLADEAYKYFESPTFIEKFGKYATEEGEVFENKHKKGRTDIHGEPLLKFNTALQRHYYEDKVGEPIFYPDNEGLRADLDTTEIKTFSKFLAYNFFTEHIDFNYSDLSFTNKLDGTLKDEVERLVALKAAELSKSEDRDTRFLGEALGNTSSSIDEWVREVKNVFKQKKINIFKNEAKLVEEEGPDNLYRKESWETSAKDSTNNNIKLFLSLLQDTTGDTNVFGEFDFIPFDSLYGVLNRVLANKVAIETGEGLEDLYDIFVDEIRGQLKFKPELEVLLDMLTDESKIDDQFKAQFTAAFNLYSKRFLGSEIEIVDGKLSYSTKDLSEVSSRRNVIMSLWHYNYQEERIDTFDLEEQLDKLEEYRSRFMRKGNITKATRDLSRVFRDLQMTFKHGRDALDYMITPSVTTTRKESLNKVRSIFESLQRALRAEIEKDDERGSLFLNGESIFKEIAGAEAYFFPEGSDASIFTLGKNKWMFSNASYLDLAIESWKKDPSILMDLYESSPINQSSELMNYFLALDENVRNEEERMDIARERIGEIEIGIFNHFQEKGKSKDAVETSDISYTDSLVDYINKQLLPNVKGGKTWSRTALASDKGTEYLISWAKGSILHIDTELQIDDTGLMTLNEEVYDIFFKHFAAEYARINSTFAELSKKDKKKLIKTYHTGRRNGLKSQLFPSMSMEFKDDGTIILPKLPFDLYQVNGKPIYKDLLLTKPSLQAQIKNVIKAAVLEGVNSTHDTFTLAGLLTKSANNKFKIHGIDEALVAHYREKGLASDDVMLKIAADAFVNGALSQIEYSKLIIGDAAYYKNNDDYKKRGSAPYTDGIYPRVLKGNETFNIATMTAVEMTTPNFAKLMEMLPPNIAARYANVNATDAQAWITPTRWKVIMEGLGKYDKHAKSAFRKMTKEAQPVYSKQEKKRMAQPLKGVYFDNSTGIPIFLKYSQAVLIPNLIKGTSLETMFDQMTKDGIDELITEDGIKVGSQQPTTVHDDNGNVVGKFKFTKQVLKSKYWKLQQDLPVKGAKMTAMGSQIQENIYQGLVHNPEATFYLDGKEQSNLEVIDHLHDIHGEFSSRGLTQLKSRLGVNFDNLKIEEGDVLFQNILKQFEERQNTPENFLTALRMQTSPLGIPGANDLFQNVFSTLANNLVIDIETLGGGFIQVSDFGMSKSEAEESGVKLTPWFAKEAARLSPPVLGIDPKTGKSRIDPGGVFLPASAIAEHIPNWATLTPAQLFGKLNEETGRYEKGKITQEILENIIGYRIPNQALSSNDALTVMGILPEGLGDSVMVYTGITEKTGSDFDIDKMFLIIPSFKPLYAATDIKKVMAFINTLEMTTDEIRGEVRLLGEQTNRMTDGEVYDTFANKILYDTQFSYHELYKEEGGDVTALKLIYEDPSGLELGEMSQGQLINRLIEVYKAVLTNTSNAALLMNPIESPHIKNHINSLAPKEAEGDLAHFNVIADLKQKVENQIGKRGLGSIVNASMGSIRGSFQPYDVVLPVKIDGELNGVQIDKEWTVELSKSDIAPYIKYYNSINEKKITKDEIKALSKLKINEVFTWLINSFVDIAMDKYIIEGKWVPAIGNVAKLLVRSGAHPFQINAFLLNPVISEWVDYYDQQVAKITIAEKRHAGEDPLVSIPAVLASFIEEKKWSGLPNTFSIGGKTKGIKAIRKRVESSLRFVEEGKELEVILGDIEDAFGYDMVKDNSKAMKSLAKTIYEKVVIEDEKNRAKARKVNFSVASLTRVVKSGEVDNKFIYLFKDLLVPAKTVATLASAGKVATEGKGKNIVSALIARNRVLEALALPPAFDESNVSPESQYVNKRGVTTKLGHAYKAVSEILDIMAANPKYFSASTRAASDSFDIISKYISGTRLIGEELGDRLEKAWGIYIMGGFPALNVSNKEKARIIRTLPSEIIEAKDEYEDNFLIQELRPYDAQEEGDIFIGLPNILKSDDYKNRLTDAWEDLFNSNPALAEKLVKYSYLTSGFVATHSQFHDRIPPAWFNTNRFNAYMDTVVRELDNIQDNFIDQFMRNNVNLSRVTKEYNSGNTTELKQVRRKDMFMTKKKFLASTPSFMAKIDSNKSEFTGGEPNYDYYKLAGMTKAGKAIYVRTSELGNYDNAGYTAPEYNLGKRDMQSVFNDNFKLSRSVPSYYVIDHRKMFGPTEDSTVLQEKKIYTSLQDEMSELAAEYIAPSARKWLVKERVKLQQATQFIGKGKEGTTTEGFRTMYETAGRANTGDYTKEDIVYVSVNGERQGRVVPVWKGKLKKAYKNIDKAMAVGATIIMDTAAHIASSKFNVGEEELAEYLHDNGYRRVVTTGKWRPGKKLRKKLRKSEGIETIPFSDAIIEAYRDRDTMDASITIEEWSEANPEVVKKLDAVEEEESDTEILDDDQNPFDFC